MPIKTPRIIAKEKPLKISPPKINIENNASKVVTDVIIKLRTKLFERTKINIELDLIIFIVLGSIITLFA